jgi:hypothetical protein
LKRSTPCPSSVKTASIGKHDVAYDPTNDAVGTDHRCEPVLASLHVVMPPHVPYGDPNSIDKMDPSDPTAVGLPHVVALDMTTAAPGFANGVKDVPLLKKLTMPVAVGRMIGASYIVNGEVVRISCPVDGSSA